MVYLLHIDTSGDIGTVAISGDGVVLSSVSTEETRNHASTINNMIATLAQNAGISLNQLNAVAVCAGPGSYTGLRIGVATAKGLCFALDIPLILDNKLTLLAYAAHKKEPMFAQYISLLVARDKEYFVSIYNDNRACMVPPQHITEDALTGMIDKDARTYMVSDASEMAIENLHINNLQVENNTKNELNSWALDSFEKYNCNHFVNLPEAEPFYLKQVYTHK